MIGLIGVGFCQSWHTRRPRLAHTAAKVGIHNSLHYWRSDQLQVAFEWSWHDMTWMVAIGESVPVVFVNADTCFHICLR